MRDKFDVRQLDSRALDHSNKGRRKCDFSGTFSLVSQMLFIDHASVSYLHVVTTALSVSCRRHLRELQRREKSIARDCDERSQWRLDARACHGQRGLVKKGERSALLMP